MKRIGIILLAITVGFTVFAQEKETSKERNEREGVDGVFKVENLFTGGNVNLSFSTYTTVLGATPQLGYHVADWLDAGIVFGFTYSSQRDDYNNKLRQTIITPGVFARLFPINELFLSTQFEHNFINQKAIAANGLSQKYPGINVNSFLLGLGYSGGRQSGNNFYYYVSVSIDVLRDRNSPYTDAYNNLLPIINAGFNIPLFQGIRRNR